ncbi:MAG TPA: flagellar basal body rod protein FlgB [Spirochaetia bacterium]|nr:flagellar basal body rod protein FlgB [Spirochaetia bacterium]
MVFNGTFGKNLDIMKRTMDVALLRRDVIANNLANSDTPHFKRTVVNFESELKRALDSENIKPFPNLMSDPRHISFQRTIDYRDVTPKRVWDYLTTSKNNGNNVDIEQESMDLVHNQLLYQAMTSLVGGEFSRVQIVLR